MIPKSNIGGQRLPEVEIKQGSLINIPKSCYKDPINREKAHQCLRFQTILTARNDFPGNIVNSKVNQGSLINIIVILLGLHDKKENIQVVGNG